MDYQILAAIRRMKRNRTEKSQEAACAPACAILEPEAAQLPVEDKKPVKAKPAAKKSMSTKKPAAKKPAAKEA